MGAGTPVVLTWYGCDLRTGGIIEELPRPTLSDALEHHLGDQSTAQMTIPLPDDPDGPQGWEAATAPGLTMLVAVDQATDIPIWAGLTLPRTGGDATTLTLGASTMEAYLDRRYPGDCLLFGVDQADICTTLITPALTDGPPLILDAPLTGATMDYQVLDSDDKTIFACLQELMGMDGGPEWTIDVAWNDTHDGFVLPVRVRAAIGNQNPSPDTTFDFPGIVSTYTLAESYETDKGANDVLERGDGEGDTRLTSDHQVATDLLAAGWCRFEYRATPSTGTTDPDQLNATGRQDLALMAQGARVWSFSATASQAPRLGRDWSLGDTVRLVVRTSPRHRAGAETVARAWAWQLDPGADAITPILVEDDTS